MSRLAEGGGLIETMQVLRKSWADSIGQSWMQSGATMEPLIQSILGLDQERKQERGLACADKFFWLTPSNWRHVHVPRWGSS